MGFDRHVRGGSASDGARATSEPGVGKRTLTGSLPIVQCYSEPGRGAAMEPASVQSAAARGTTGSERLPHLEQIQRAFGAHDVSDVKATVGGTATAACETIGAESYAQGNNVAFKESPSLWLAAHEAAHAVQQRTGASIAGGVGQAGDVHEQHANRVADRVVAGDSVEALFGTPGGGAATTAVQRYQRQQVEGQRSKVSGTGLSAVVPSQKLFADSSLVATANAALKSVGKQGSHIKLVEDTKQRVKPKQKQLNRVLPVWVPHKDDGNHASCSTANDGGKDSNGDKGDDLALWTDCGNASGAVTGSQLNGDRKVVYNKDGKEQVSAGFDDKKQTYHDAPHNFSNQVYFDLMPGFIANPANSAYLFKDKHYTEAGGKRTPVPIPDALTAKTLYHELKLAGRDAFDKAAGINHFANPNIGEAYTMATEANMPRFKKAGDMTWNFHWAGVVMKDGSDNITLENFAVTEETANAAKVPQGKFIDRDWNFDMYGTVDAKGDVDESQTFHNEHLNTGTHGNRATSMAVRTDK